MQIDEIVILQCQVCGAETKHICDWCSVPTCPRHLNHIPVHYFTIGGMPNGTADGEYCDGCMPDDAEYNSDPEQ